jgi:hypothetical protein
LSLWRALALLLGSLLSASALGGLAEAYVRAGPTVMPGGHHRLKTTILPPLDSLPATVGAYSFRKVRQAYSGPAVQLRRADNGVLLDINFTASGDLDAAAAATHCSGTTCNVLIWYDQGVTARNMTPPFNYPFYVLNCIGARPCLRVNDQYQQLGTASYSVTAGKTTLNAVGRRSTGTAECRMVSKSANILGASGANSWQLSDQTTNLFQIAAADNVWHAVTGWIDGAASAARVDTTEVAGAAITGYASPGTGVALQTDAAGTVCEEVEQFGWDNLVLTLAQRTALGDNQKAYWGY